MQPCLSITFWMSLAYRSFIRHQQSLDNQRDLLGDAILTKIHEFPDITNEFVLCSRIGWWAHVIVAVSLLTSSKISLDRVWIERSMDTRFCRFDKGSNFSHPRMFTDSWKWNCENTQLWTNSLFCLSVRQPRAPVLATPEF